MPDETRDPAGPQPEPIRFFGTTWVNHDGGYGPRRAGVALGALAAAAAGAFLLRFGYEGLAVAETGSFLRLLVVAAFSVCSALAFRRTWNGFTERPSGEAQGVVAIGFIGALLAYAARAMIEAPGEKRSRAEYERERERFARRPRRKRR